MNALLCCCRDNFIPEQQEGPGNEQFGERSLQAIVNDADDLSQRILGNDALFGVLHLNYDQLKGLPGFRDGVYVEQCKALVSNLNTLKTQRKEQEKTRNDLKQEFRAYLGRHLILGNYNFQESINHFNKVIKQKDSLNEIDTNLDRLHDCTFDYKRECCDGPLSVCCVLPTFPLWFCCNKTCCGLKGRIEQLKYATRKGIPLKGPSCCIMD